MSFHPQPQKELTDFIKASSVNITLEHESRCDLLIHAEDSHMPKINIFIEEINRHDPPSEAGIGAILGNEQHS